MIDLLLILLRPALLWESDKIGHWYLAPVAVLAWVADIIIAHTTWAAIYGWPKRGEWTISHTLERLCKDTEHDDYELLVQIALKINRVSPTKAHIHAVLP